MDEFDLTEILDRIVEDYWDARILIDGRKPWAEVDLDTKNKIKEQVLPWVFRSAPLIAEKVKAQVNRFIRDAREGGLTDAEIVNQIALESEGA